MTDYTRFEKIVLGHMKKDEKMKLLKLAQKKAVVKHIWNRLNEASVKGGTIAVAKKAESHVPIEQQEPERFESNIPHNVVRLMDILKLYGSAKTAYEIGKLVKTMYL